MNTSLKIACLLACIVLGFAFPPAFIGAIILSFGIYIDVNKDHDAPSVSGRNGAGDRYYTKEEHFRKVLESPAEEAFFDALVSHFDLKVRDGRLVGNDEITVDMQVEVLKYRLDFLIDKRLVVEIDGAAWHSSAEAIARDNLRDAHLREAGYHILRIPAKKVFNDPNGTIDSVRDARKQVEVDNKVRFESRVQDASSGGAPVGTPLQQIGTAIRPKRMFAAVSDALKDIDVALTEASKKTEEIRAHKEFKEKAIAHAITPLSIKMLRQKVDRDLITVLLLEKRHELLVDLINSDDPAGLAQEIMRDRAAEAERKRLDREWNDEHIPF